jgi:hypothetical protein
MLLIFSPSTAGKIGKPVATPSVSTLIFHIHRERTDMNIVVSPEPVYKQFPNKSETVESREAPLQRNFDDLIVGGTLL